MRATAGNKLRNEIYVYMQNLIHYGDKEVFATTSAPEPSMTVLAEKAAIEFEEEMDGGWVTKEDLDEIAFDAHDWWETH